MSTYRLDVFTITAEPGKKYFDERKSQVGDEFEKVKSLAQALLIVSVLRQRPPLFELGQIVATPGAIDLLDRCGVNANELLLRHNGGDWGDICDDDATANSQAVEHKDRIFSVYKLGLKKEPLWIITEHDRSVTTLLLPEEY